METEVYQPNKYPTPVAQLRALPPLAITIANRWMRGWPEIVKTHLESGEYLGYLKDQEEKQRRALADPTTHHLAHREPTMPGP